MATSPSVWVLQPEHWWKGELMRVKETLNVCKVLQWNICHCLIYPVNTRLCLIYPLIPIDSTLLWRHIRHCPSISSTISWATLRDLVCSNLLGPRLHLQPAMVIGSAMVASMSRMVSGNCAILRMPSLAPKLITWKRSGRTRENTSVKHS